MMTINLMAGLASVEGANPNYRSSLLAIILLQSVHGTKELA